MFHKNGVKEVAVERAELAARAASIEAASSVREQERQIQLRTMSAMSERALEEKYFRDAYKDAPRV